MHNDNIVEYLAQGFNRIPFTREVLADTETPVSCYLKLANNKYSYLFESVQGGEKWGRYSIIGLSSSNRMVARGEKISIFKQDQLVEEFRHPDPLEYVKEYQAQFRVPEVPELPMFSGGLVGYFGYDCVRYVEKKLKYSSPIDMLGTPDILLMVSDEVLVFDNLRGKIHIVVHIDAREDCLADKAQARFDAIEGQLKGSLPNSTVFAFNEENKKPNLEQRFSSSFGEAEFKEAVGEIKEHILAGDTMQVVLSQRLSHDFNAAPIDLYRALRSLNPSPYMYFLHLDEHFVVGSSPEILARLEDGEVTVRPIAGTRRRGHSDEEDKALELDLVNDPKEIAEHLMLIDLGRNDVGRVAEVGTVKLTEKMVVERFSHVMHITSNVTGQVPKSMHAIDVLKAALPAGTLSGAPKIRAMEIIDELEPVRRGIYGGAVGYIAWNGNMDTAIAIRTAVVKDKKVYVQAGAGVVADSQPALEWKETMNKARALIAAVDLVQSNNDENS